LTDSNFEEEKGLSESAIDILEIRDWC